jgi:hypothetical protein
MSMTSAAPRLAGGCVLLMFVARRIKRAVVDFPSITSLGTFGQYGGLRSRSGAPNAGAIFGSFLLDVSRGAR